MAMVVAGTVPGATLDVTSVDASAYPTVVIDFVVPAPYAAVDLTPAMVDIDGAPVDAVAQVDAASVVVRLVVDDRPVVPADVIGASQGAAVEFVRNTAIGTRIAVGTPSGLQTAVTSDPVATIARIAAITAGAPAVSPLPGLILDSAAALAADESTARHLVVALGGPLEGSEVQLAEIADVVAASGVTLHILRAAGAEEPALTLIAEQSGGTAADSSEALAFFDVVSAAISNRYRITTTLTAPGDHVVGLRIDGAPPITARFDVEPPEVASEAPVPEIASATTLGVPAVVTGPVSTTAVAESGSADTALPDDGTTASDEESESPFGAIAVALEISMAVVVAVWLVMRWRRRWRDRGADLVTSSQPVLVGGAEASTAEPQQARDAQGHAAARPRPARKLPARETTQPLPVLGPAVSRRSASEPDGGHDARSQAEPALAGKDAPHDVGAEPAVHEATDAAAGVGPEGPTPTRPPRRKLALATTDDTSSEAVAADELESAPVTPKPKPKSKRTPAAEHAATARADAEEERVPEPTPKRPTKPKQPLETASASATETAVAKEAAPKPEPVDATQLRPARAKPPSRSVRRRGGRSSPASRTRRSGRREFGPAVAAEESSSASEWLVAGNLRFRPASGEVWSGSHRVKLTPSELAILELLVTGGNRGVTEADIIGAGGLEPDGRNIAEMLDRIRHKTGLAGRGPTVRRERVMLYFLDDEVETGAAAQVSHRRGRPSVRR